LKTDQHLFFDRRELLDDDVTLQALGIPPGAQLLLKVRCSTTYTLQTAARLPVFLKTEIIKKTEISERTVARIFRMYNTSYRNWNRYCLLLNL